MVSHQKPAQQKATANSMTKRLGIYAGTFDPVTFGHMDIICRSVEVVDELIVAVAEDTAKTPLFTLEKRAEMVRATIAEKAPAVASRIRVETFSGLLVNFAREHGARILFRGLRAVSDYEYEFQMACMNSRLAPEIETLFLTASESTHFISSRFVKQIGRLGGDISGFVTDNVRAELTKTFEKTK